MLGVKFVKELLAPMPWSKLMVTGGVEPTQENLALWIEVGVFCMGMGANFSLMIKLLLKIGLT